MEKHQVFKSVLQMLPSGGIQAVSDRSGYPRSTVVDCLSNYRPNRRIDAQRIYRTAAEFLRERGINFEPLTQYLNQ